MTTSDSIVLWLAASIATGVTAHVMLAARSRRIYCRLRDAYIGAVSAAQQTGDVAALVRAQELYREFMRATEPAWLTGLGARLKAAVVLCAVGGVAVMLGTGRLPPAMGGVAVLFAIGVRRILLATALLLALFAVTSLTSVHSERRTAAASAPVHPARPPTPSAPRTR